MAKKKNPTHAGMIAAANKAATGMQSSPIAKQLAANGFTPATMAQAASDVTDLLSKADAARSASHQATVALEAKLKDVATMLSSFSNFVRGLTADAAVRKALGVASPGKRKGPTFHRGPRKKAAAQAPATVQAKPQQ